MFHIIAVLLTLSAAFGYLNHRYIKLPTTIGTMLISMVVSVGIVVLGHFGGLGFDIKEHWLTLIQSIDFNETVLVGMLGFLLFAGGSSRKPRWSEGPLHKREILSPAHSTTSSTPSMPLALCVQKRNRLLQ